MTEYFDLSKILDEEQFKAADSIDGAVEVFACAGSGKTRVLTYRIVNMVKNYGINPKNILALTFTNKAANEMKKRVESYLGIDSENITLSTIHSFCCKMMRENIEKIPDGCFYKENFQIKDEEESKVIFFKLFKEDKEFLSEYFYQKEFNSCNDEKKAKQRQDDDLRIYFSDIKALFDNDVEKYKILNKELTKDLTLLFSQINDFRQKSINLSEDDFKKVEISFGLKLEYKTIIYIIATYENHLERYNLMDFILILKNAVRFLKSNLYLREYLHNRYKYILIDEYQDVDSIQELLIFYLSGKADNASNINIFVVGDDDQSIYGWRGVEYGNLQRFEKEYNAKKFHLSTNYRSTDKIVKKAKKLIDNNTYREKKELLSNRFSSLEPQFKKYDNLDEEKQSVVYTITKLRRDGESLSDIAILSRTGRRASLLLSYLTLCNIPYVVKGMFDPKKRKEVKMLRKYLKFLINRDDHYSLYDMISVFDGIGTTTIKKLQDFCSTRYRHLDAFLDDSYLTILSKKQQELMIPNIDFIKESIKRFDLNPIEFLEFLVDTTRFNAIEKSFMYPIFKSYIDKDKKELKDVDEIYQYLSSSLREILNQARQTNDIVEAINNFELNSQEDKKDQDAVSVLTIHASKGLEFKNVIILGSEYNLFEKQFNIYNVDEEQKKNIEEERRVFYVAMTRAENLLHITFVKNNFMNEEKNFVSPSQFIYEAFPEYKCENKNSYNSTNTSYMDSHSFTKSLQNSLQTRLEDVKKEKPKYFSPGDRIFHPKYGKGTIKKVTTQSAVPFSYIIIFDENLQEEIEISTKFKMLKKV